eukprot:5559505-Lingulodinium_polyedra.AAC.1
MRRPWCDTRGTRKQVNQRDTTIGHPATPMKGCDRQTGGVHPRDERRRMPRRGSTLDAEQWLWRAHWSSG